MKYRVVQMVDGTMIQWETEDIMAAMEVRDVAHTGFLRRRGLREQLQGQPTFNGFAGPMWDGDAIRYEDAAVYERMGSGSI